jgi:hypothetical protein
VPTNPFPLLLADEEPDDDVRLGVLLRERPFADAVRELLDERLAVAAVLRRLVALDGFLAGVLLRRAGFAGRVDRFVPLLFVLSAISNSPWSGTSLVADGLPEPRRVDATCDLGRAGETGSGREHHDARQLDP